MTDAQTGLTQIWPKSARRTDGVVSLHGFSAAQLLCSFGSPLYVVDLDEVMNRAKAFCEAAADAFSTSTTSVSFAGKAFLSKEIVRLLVEAGLHIDTCTLGEMRIALAGGAPGRSLVLHGNNKSDEEIELAITRDFSKIVIDSEDEPERVAAIAHRLGKRAKVMVRVTTGIHAGGHEFISTAHEDQKFGIPLLPPATEATDAASLSMDMVADGPALAVLKNILLHSEDLELVGIHSHIGSQIHSAEAFIEAAQRVLRLREAFWATDGFVLPEVDLGGGYSVAYLDDDESMDIRETMKNIAAAMREESKQSGLPMPVVSFEPGRWIVAPSGISLYKVGTVKPVHLSDGTTRTYVSVDGGMSDNIRPALYDAEYTAVLANRPGSDDTILCRIAGLHCESGDIIVHNVELPADIKRGDLLAVPVTGAYGRTMASNYNQALRPAVIAVSSNFQDRDSEVPGLSNDQGEAHVMLRRDTITDLLSLDMG
jgi:diaminopimelate decarboxylase